MIEHSGLVAQARQTLPEQTGSEPPQLALDRHSTQAPSSQKGSAGLAAAQAGSPLPSVQSGVGSPQSPSVRHWTQAPPVEQKGVSGFLSMHSAPEPQARQVPVVSSHTGMVVAPQVVLLVQATQRPSDRQNGSAGSRA